MVTNEDTGYEGVQIRHDGFNRNDEKQKMVQYAYEIGGMQLVILIECENGNRNPFLQSTVINNGKREPSYGLCQIHKKYHPNIINNANFWNDWKFQIDYCNKLLQGGTKFYGPTRIIKGTNKQCKEYVVDRFTFIE